MSKTLIVLVGLTLVAPASTLRAGCGGCGDGDRGHHSAPAHATGHHQATGVFAGVLGDYEAIRQALLHDKLDGVAERARSIRRLSEELDADFDAARAGVPTEHAAACRSLLPELEKAAGGLADATELSPAREAFFTLSIPLVRYRQMAGTEQPIVVYCSMAKKTWLQPAGEIGNPYYGQRMARCGQVVSS